MADAGPAAGFVASDAFGLGAVGGIPGASGQFLGDPGGLFGHGNYAQPGAGAGPAGGMMIHTGPTDIGAAFAGGSVAGIPLSTASSRVQTNALASFVAYYSDWHDGWHTGIRPGSLLFPVKNIVLASRRGGGGGGGGGPNEFQEVVEQGGVVKEKLTSAIGQRMTVATIPIVNWLLEESARRSHAKRMGTGPPENEAIYERRKWAFVDREEEGIEHHKIDFTSRFVGLFGRHPLMEINRGPAYDDNPFGGVYGATLSSQTSSKRARTSDHPHLLAVPNSDGLMCETPNIWGYPKRGDKLSLRLRYYDSRLEGLDPGWKNPYTEFRTPDGRRAAFDATTDTGFLQLVPCVYSRYGGDPAVDPEGSYCLPHRSTKYDAPPRPTDLDWWCMSDEPDEEEGELVPGYQTGLEIFVGTVKEEPEPFDIARDPTPLRDETAYNNLPKVRIIFGK